MASKTVGSLAQFAALLDVFANDLEHNADLSKAGEDNPVWKTAQEIGGIFLSFAQQQSPYDTGTLEQAHTQSETELRSVSQNQASAVTEVFVAKGQWNPKYGGFPGDYGPEYHMTKRQWFDEAMGLSEPYIDQALERGFRAWVQMFAL